MLLFMCDVLFHLSTQELTYRECRIPGLPLKTAKRCVLGLCPLRRGPLQFLDPFGHGDGASLACQTMHVIGDATNADYRAIQSCGDGAKVAVHRNAMARMSKKGTPLFS